MLAQAQRRDLKIKPYAIGASTADLTAPSSTRTISPATSRSQAIAPPAANIAVSRLGVRSSSTAEKNSPTSLILSSRAANFNNADFLHLVGNISGGGTVTADFPLAFGFANFALAGFTGLDSMVISGFVTGGTSNASWAVDNIQFAQGRMPEPATLALLALALAGLGFARRREAH